MVFPTLGYHAERGLTQKIHIFTIAYRENYCTACGERILGDGIIRVDTNIDVDTYEWEEIVGWKTEVHGAFSGSPTTWTPPPPPCPPRISRITGSLQFLYTIQEANKLASKESKDRVDSGRYKEVGGWIIQSKKGDDIRRIIKIPEAEFVDGQRTDTATRVRLDQPEKHIKEWLDKGYRIAGDFHTHVDKLTNQEDVDIANNERKVPGVWIYSDGTYKTYGPERGFLGVGVPKHCR